VDQFLYWRINFYSTATAFLQHYYNVTTTLLQQEVHLFKKEEVLLFKEEVNEL